MSSVLSVKEVEQGNTASYGATLPISAQRVFQVTFDEWDYTNVLLACVADDGTVAIPTAGDAFSGSITTLKAQAPTARPVNGKSGRVFWVTVNYQSNDASIGGNKSLHPLDRPLRWFAGSYSVTMEIDRDTHGNLIESSANQVMKTNISWDHLLVRAVWTAESMTDYRSYRNTVNDAQVVLNSTYTCAAKTVRLPSIAQDEVDELYEGENVNYFLCTAPFYVVVPRAGDVITTWGLTLLDQGTLQHDDGSPPRQIPIIRDGAQLASPVRLDGFGYEEVDQSNDPYFLDTNAAVPPQIVWNTVPNKGVEAFAEADWSALPPFV